MRASDFDLLFVPGPSGDSEEDWSGRWRAKLSTARLIHPADSLSLTGWIVAIAGAARAAERPILFVGHGLGAVMIARASETLGGLDVRGAFLVAPMDDDGLARLAREDWKPARTRLPWPAVVIASRNDPEGAYDAVAARAFDWGAELIDAGFAGSLNAASGYGPWPEGLMRLAGFMAKIGKTG